MADLRRANIVVSQRGALGGFKLARAAEDVSLADVIRAVDGPLATVRGERPPDLEYEGSTVMLKVVWVAVRAQLRHILEGVSVKDVASGQLPEYVKKIAEDPAVWT